MLVEKTVLVFIVRKIECFIETKKNLQIYITSDMSLYYHEIRVAYDSSSLSFAEHSF